ncbi:MAG: hypothetical protein PGN29_18315 [Gordonia paraffinivorans]
MNTTVAIALVLVSACAAVVCLGRALTVPRIDGPGSLLAAALTVAVVAWVAGGLVSWSLGTGPARPGVFAGYAVTAAAMLPVGLPMARRLGGRGAEIACAAVFGLLAFLCYRTEAVWLVAR